MPSEAPRVSDHDEQASESGASLIEMVSSLREDLWSLTADLQEALEENRRLRREMDRVRRRRTDPKVSALHRVKREVDELAGLPRPPARGRSSRSGERLREMMMLMLVADLF